MSHEVAWNKIILETFCDTAILTETEEKVLRFHCAGFSRVKISSDLNISLSTVDRTVKRLKNKYDDAAKYNPILPPRRRLKDNNFNE